MYANSTQDEVVKMFAGKRWAELDAQAHAHTHTRTPRTHTHARSPARIHTQLSSMPRRA